MADQYTETNNAAELPRFDVIVLLNDMWRGFKKMFWVAIVASAVLSLLLAVYARVTWRPVYRSSATFSITLSTDYGTSNRYYTAATAEQMGKTFPYIIKSGILSSIVANDLGLSYVPASITATSIKSTGLFTIAVTAGDAQLSYDVLQSVMKNYPQVASFVVGDTVLTLMGESGVPQTPANPFSFVPSVKKGVLGGVALCLVCVVFYALLHKTVRRPEEIRRMVNTQCIGTVPRVKRKKGKQQTLLLSDPQLSSSFREAIYRLRGRVEKSGAHTVLVTSALAGEGKTTLAVNLALALAEKGYFVLLVDGDLRNPSIEKLLGTHHRFGVSDYLDGKAEFTQIGYVLSQYKNFGVIPAGHPTQEASEKISSPRMKELIRQGREMADYVIIDSAPSAFLSDASVMAAYADGSLMVIRHDHAPRDRILDGLEGLADSKSPILGCILNDMPKDMVSGHSYYGGSYGQYGGYK